MNLEDQLRELIDLTPPHIQRHFACDCAERALKAANVRDERSWNVIKVSRIYAEGKASANELNTARNAARAAAWDAAWDAERRWQITHLQSLMDTYDATRSSLLRVLHKRAESIKSIFVQYAQSLEERVFE